MEPKEVKRHSADNGEICWSVTTTQGRQILLKHHIFDPMQTIFNVPVLANALRKLSRL
ncbi:MAG: hypothetical protein ACAF41_05910 [Leptolyngbya sp. BL-A-14]